MWASTITPRIRKLYDLLTEDGVALVHTIGRLAPPTATDPFIAKYIFPGGYVPALSEIVPAIERSGLIVADVEILRRHYAKTLRLWRERFLANWDKAAALRGERFCRMWEFYLAWAEAAFRYQRHVVFQMQLVKRRDAVPLTRDYLADAEQRLLEKEVGRGNGSASASANRSGRGRSLVRVGEAMNSATEAAVLGDGRIHRFFAV
jgi:cyclopropane-fatty-acyl-phospholipid synthase